MSIVRPPIPRLSLPRASASVLAVMLLLAAPLMSSCLQRSTTVGDRFAGSVIVATSPDNPRGAPKFDIPESMAGNIAVSAFQDKPASPTSSAPGDDNDNATRVGSRATFSNLTAGQLGQLGDIVANAFGDTEVSMELDGKRSGGVVRFRGTADLNGLIAGRDYVKLTMSFAGPITATNGDQNTDTSVSWTPEPGKPADFTAEATYPDPSTAAFGGWTWLMVLICTAVVLVVIRLAYVSRYRGPRPGRPVPGSGSGSASSQPAASTGFRWGRGTKKPSGSADSARATSTPGSTGPDAARTAGPATGSATPGGESPSEEAPGGEAKDR